MSETTATINQYSFRYHYDSLPRNKQPEARQRIKDIFGIISDQQLYKRIDGEIEPKISEAQEVVRYFSTYGIKINW